MKKTIYFKSQEEMLDYYGGEVSNIPSNTLAIVADENDFVLFSTSNNQSMNGSMEDQGGYIDNISGYAYVTTNGDHNVASYEMVNVNVPNVIPSGYVYVNGTYNISDNGTFDVSSYENAYVNVSGGGGGTEYIFLDPEVDTKTTGSYYEFNGQLNSGAMMQITSDFAQAYPGLEPYIGWYVYTINGDEINPQSTGHWSETCIIEDTDGLDGLAVIAKGQYVELISGNPMFVIDSLKQARYAGGNGGLTIQSNGTQDVTRLSYVTVDVNVVPTYNIIDSLPESDNGWYFQIKELDGYSVPTGNVKYLFIKYNSSGEIVSYNYNFDEIFTATGFSDGSSLGLNIIYNGQGGITFGFENYIGSDSSDYINPLAFTQGETEVLRPTADGFYYGLGGNFDVSDPKIFIWNTKVSMY